jgi:hypothetical protein
MIVLVQHGVTEIGMWRTALLWGRRIPILGGQRWSLLPWRTVCLSCVEVIKMDRSGRQLRIFRM